MSINILISTMHQKSQKLLKKMNISTSAVVINQNNILPNKIDKIVHKDNTITWVDIQDKGLSKSRNLAIKYSNSKISVIADDDLIYVDNYSEIIHKAYEEFPHADIICFQVEGINKVFKNYKSKPRMLNFFSTLKISSVEITFKTDSIKNNDIVFEEEFGAGAKFFMGEENIFLSECLRKGLKIQYVPQKIANLNMGDSTWFNGYSKDFFISRGASFYKISKKLSDLLIIQWAIRKHKEYKAEMSFKDATKLMFKGKKKVKNSRSN